MKMTRIGAAILAGALLSQLFVRLHPPSEHAQPKMQNQIHDSRNDIDNQVDERVRARDAEKLNQLERILAKAPPATANATQQPPQPITSASRSDGDPALPAVMDSDWGRGKFAHFTRDEYAQMAAHCELRWQMPPFGAGPSAFGAGYDRALAAAETRERAALAALYRESGGDDAGLSLRLLDDAVRALDQGDAIAVHRRLAGELAGDAPTGDDSIYARYLRLQLGAGDAFEADLTREAGAAEARAWRESAGAKNTVTGCEGEPQLFRSSR